ncbi:MAG: DUF4249 domain-containing protein [Phaeodactylibacter sp.]|nr:DUF4249 domain-containing protein [Phaeodactylibacter sp.]MCB9287849.1 DUF4249 domain-containing protein [Lewinellaceae bacterium]
MRIKAGTLLLFLALLANSCIEEFRPPLNNFDNLLVVDGHITNQPGPYTIKLSTSANLDIVKYTPLPGATVTIEEENGPVEILTETEPGVYQTAADGIQGKAGRKYQLRIATPGGKQYESGFETIKEPTAIASVRAEYDTRYFDEEEGPIPGLQFYISTGPSSYEKDYYLWLMEGTYKYEADLDITNVYDGGVKPYYHGDSLKTCWRTYTVPELTTASTANRAEQQLTDIPLFFLRGDDKKLSIRYSLLTKQYAISKEAYLFWSDVEEQSAQDGSLYTTQPFQIRGNIHNPEASEEPVLGYFFAAGVTEDRSFFDRPPELNVELPECGYNYDALMAPIPPEEWPVFLTIGPDGLALSGLGCLDCREAGGTIIPPEFWIE